MRERDAYTTFTSPHYYFPSGNVVRQQGFEKHFVASGIVKGNRKKPNPWSFAYDILEGLSGEYVYAYPGPSYPQSWESGQLSTSPFSFPVDFTYYQDNAYNDALDRLNGKIRGQLDLATSLAEAGQTVKMLNLVDRYTSLVNDMANSYRRELGRNYANLLSKRAWSRRLARWQSGYARRHPGLYRPIPLRKKPGVVSNASALGANGWLEFTYGLSPLLSDISNIANQLVRHTRNAMVVKARGTAEISESKSTPVSYGGFSGSFPGTATGAVSVTISVRMLPNWDKSLSQWTSLNPVSVGYELLTLSFVLDWFLNVGNYLRNLETSLAYNTSFESGFVSILRHCEWVVAGSGINQYPWGDTYVLNGKTFRKSVAFNRSLIYSYPTPVAPRFQAQLGWQRLISAAALLRQLLR